jgi:Uma2 family endonuclease
MAARSSQLMASQITARKLTYDDFVNFPDDGQRHELIDGEHYVTPSPATKHQRISGRLFGELYKYFETTAVGEVFHAPFDVVLSFFDVVEPDLLVVLNDQSTIVTDKHVRGTPAIVVEILSPGTRRVDEKIKRDLYERSGVREYWIVDPEPETIAIHRRSTAGAFRRVAVLRKSKDDLFSSALLPGWSIGLTTLFK